jgi:spermidine/putrescine transport system ATP-binding protein
MVFQNYALFPHMTVAQNVAFGLRMEQLADAEIRARTAEYLDLVGLAGFGHRMPAELSGGQAQRVALARALAKRPAVLLLDEPLGALDLKLRKHMQVELARIHRQVGTTFVFVTHDQEEALSMATRIAIMSGGKVRQTGTPREIYDRPVDRFVANFVGETNFIEGTLRHVDGRRVLELGDGSSVAAPGDAGDDGKATLMIRPESTDIRRAASGTGDAVALPGRIVNVAFLGASTRITISTAAGDISVLRPHGSAGTSETFVGELGEEVCVCWQRDDAAIVSA